MKYSKVKDEYTEFSNEELETLKNESFINSFQYTKYYRCVIMRLIKTIENMKNKGNNNE